MSRHSCVVLLATYNGQSWLPEQLVSIRDQQGVDVKVIVSDDQSDDSTLAILSEYSSSLAIDILPQEKFRYGRASRNFLRLIRDSDIGDAQYIAFADQDDIWHLDKLDRAISKINLTHADAYSSDVEAFWPDGRVKIIKKSHPQKTYDYLFESPGPGCTIVFKRETYISIRNWALVNYSDLLELWVHDWFLYAYARSKGYCWIIDDQPSMRYRQHQSNEIGANIGIAAIRNRLSTVMSGLYRENVIKICELLSAYPHCSTALRRLSWRDRLWLIAHAPSFRRSLKHVIMLQLIFLFIPATSF